MIGSKVGSTPFGVENPFVINKNNLKSAGNSIPSLFSVSFISFSEAGLVPNHLFAICSLVKSKSANSIAFADIFFNRFLIFQINRSRLYII